ncbi:hypothetical protein E4K67_22470 [Desulfosporosinus fructosivorans]|uniref:Uncharacterized protein n=1 Tax=Desulfosporosinus fructosivorans TaxID=2018669 RepID=A0A4Z0QZK2_9FIRM|nr:hypothetical protein [Desulfosporosinus fructosivorans]TGE35884.1 hypothetical protein E4K67_22470 [Desulfosporosinus fructosivorans]
MPPESVETSMPEIRTTAFYSDEYEKLKKERGVSEESQQASSKWNEAGDKMKEGFQCQDQ